MTEQLPHPAEMTSEELRQLQDALRRFVATGRAPLYLKTAAKPLLAQ
jgi:hypothetical protein